MNLFIVKGDFQCLAYYFQFHDPKCSVRSKRFVAMINNTDYVQSELTYFLHLFIQPILLNSLPLKLSEPSLKNYNT